MRAFARRSEASETEPGESAALGEQCCNEPLGLGFTGYEGLPVIPMVVQEYTNGNAGGVFGSMTPALWEVSYSSE